MRYATETPREDATLTCPGATQVLEAPHQDYCATTQPALTCDGLHRIGELPGREPDVLEKGRLRHVQLKNNVLSPRAPGLPRSL